jgi:glycosyltransferase involved in cell wall biosynthesis
VGSDVAGLAEHVVEGETGFLVSPDDLDTLTAALEALLGDEDEAGRLGTCARERAEEQLSPAAAARRLRRLWSEGADRGPQLAATRHDRSA